MGFGDKVPLGDKDSKQTDKETDKQADKQADKSADKQTTLAGQRKLSMAMKNPKTLKASPKTRPRKHLDEESSDSESASLCRGRKAKRKRPRRGRSSSRSRSSRSDSSDSGEARESRSHHKRTAARERSRTDIKCPPASRKTRGGDPLPSCPGALAHALAVNTSTAPVKIKLHELLCYKEPAGMLILFMSQVVDEYEKTSNHPFDAVVNSPLSEMLELGLNMTVMQWSGVLYRAMQHLVDNLPSSS